MTDAHTQAHRRAAAAGDPQAGARALAAELRAGEIKFDLERARDLYACRDPKPYTTVRGVRCQACSSYTRPRTDCNACGATGTLPYDPWDLLRLRAYLGDEAARVLLGDDCEACTERVGLLKNPCTCGNADTAYTSHLCEWLKDLERLASKLPPTRVEVECPNRRCVRGEETFWHPEPWENICVSVDCDQCGGTGKVPHDTPAERYLLVVAAHAVAREMLGPVSRHSIGGTTYAMHGLGTSGDAAARALACKRALDASSEWIACPCPEHEDAWESAHPGRGLDTVWVPAPVWKGGWLDWPGRFRVAAKVLGDDRTCRVAAQAVLEVLRG